MSLQSYVEEYEPEGATAILKRVGSVFDPDRRVDDLLLLRHALRKWNGRMPANTTRHDVHPHQLPKSECTLCARAIVERNTVNPGLPSPCSFCPISASRDGYSCDDMTEDERIRFGKSPWRSWTEDSDPHPMVEVLESAIRYIETTPG